MLYHCTLEAQPHAWSSSLTFWIHASIVPRSSSTHISRFVQISLDLAQFFNYQAWTQQVGGTSPIASICPDISSGPIVANKVMLTVNRPQLPALSYLDIDKAKEEMYQSRHSSAAQNHSSALPSPSHQYPSGPPPPYSHPPPLHANNWSGAKSPLPGSRRASGEEHDGVKQKQSLPSLSEALGVESQTSYSQPPPTSQPLPLSTHQSQPAAPTSPSPIRKRSYGMDSSETHNPYQYSFFRQDSAAPQSQQAVETKHTYPPIQESRPPLHLQTAHPSRDYRPEKIGQSQTSSPQFERSTAQSTSSMGPPSFPYGYTPYPPRYAQPSPASSNAGPIYQPSSQYPAPQTPSSNWKSENSSSSRFGPDDRHTTPPAYGDSVKRHLDLYDLEVALTEVSRA